MNKKIILSIFIFFTLVISKSVFARTPTFPNNAKYTRGVSKVCYYVDSTASGYTSLINSAINNWVDTGYGWNPIYVTPVSSNYATHMDFYAEEDINSKVLDRMMLGHTSYWNTDGTAVAEFENEKPNYNYFYTESRMNTSRSDSKTKYAVSHEIGHAFGLDHHSLKISIMYPFSNGNNATITTVQKEDHDAINYLYN